MNGFLTLNWENVKSAVVYGVLMVFVTFFLAAAGIVLEHGSIYGVDWANAFDRGVISALGVIVSLVSLLKNLLTNDQGKFLGVIEVVPDKTNKA